MEGGYPELTNSDSDSDSLYQIYDIGAMTSRIIGCVKVALITTRNLSKRKTQVQDVAQAKPFQLKGRHSTVSPEELSEKWQMGLEQAREKIAKTT